MADALDRLTQEEIEELAGTERRLAAHAAAAKQCNPACYDALGNYVYWLDVLTRDRGGAIEKSFSNLCRLLEFDSALHGIGYNRFADRFEVREPLPWRKQPGPWREADDAMLARYVDERYCRFPLSFYGAALAALADQRSFHPVLDYLLALPPWDGTPRAERLLVDCLGAADTDYVRAVTRKALCAAVRRVFAPGCKFDAILVLSGPQGIGKSCLLARLGGPWFSDSLNLADMNDKTAAEQLQGHWILEISEMAGRSKAELEKVKAFLSRQDDKFRAAYARRVSAHPRQCVFFGTTNEEGYLRDLTGNRRFWTVPVTGQGSRRPWELRREELDQIWAEILTLAGEEPLYLSETLADEAREIQRQALEEDDREGMVRVYLDTPIPADFNTRSYSERVLWYQTPSLARTGEKALTRRDTVSNLEIWCECFGEPKQRLNRRESAAISGIMARIEGWERTENSLDRGIYGRQRCYVRTPPEKHAAPDVSSDV